MKTGKVIVIPNKNSVHPNKSHYISVYIIEKYCWGSNLGSYTLEVHTHMFWDYICQWVVAYSCSQGSLARFEGPYDVRIGS